MTSSRDLSKLAGLASQYADSETLRLARQAMGADAFVRILRPSSVDELLQRAMADANMRSYGSSTVQDSIARALQITDPYSLGGASEAMRKEMARSLALGSSGLGFGAFRSVGTVTEEVYKSLFGSFGGTVGDVLRNLKTQPVAGDFASVRDLTIEQDAVRIGALGRATLWSDHLTGLKASDFAGISSSEKAVREQIEAVTAVAGGLSAVQDALLGGRPERAFEGSLGATFTKLSLFAGSIDVLGPASVGNHAAFDALMGGYSTAAAPVDRRYWARADERARYYRDHDVDEGLIEADAAATVTTLIETGVADGGLTRRGTVKLILPGDVHMEIIASRPKATAFAAIDAFEGLLRQFIERHLSAVAGEKWFVQRVSGDIVVKAKAKRREAILAGEETLSLIHYVDIGELLQIMISNSNWKVFGPIIGRLEWLRTYLERLNALRRPVAHSRPFEAVQLVEVVTTIRILTSWMQRGPDWQDGWDADI